MELMRFPLENTHSSGGEKRQEGVDGGNGRGVVLKLSFFFAGNVSRGQEWYESRGLVSGRDGPRDSIGQM